MSSASIQTRFNITGLTVLAHLWVLKTFPLIIELLKEFFFQRIVFYIFKWQYDYDNELVKVKVFRYKPGVALRVPGG
jgi:hypothetical protein